MSVPEAMSRRREPRYVITNPQALSVEIETQGNTNGRIPAVLMDLSRGGLRLSVGSVLPKGEPVRLTINARAVDFQFHADAKVCWAAPGAKEGWFLGCSLEERVPENAIAQLAAGSALERRRDTRKAVAFTAEARTELAGEFTAVQVVNYSAGGFRALAKGELAAVGERIMLKLTVGDDGKPRTIRAKVCWIDQLADGYAFGCSFLTREDYLSMQSIVDPNSRERWRRSLRKHRPTQWRMIAASIALILTLQLCHVARSRPDLVQRFDEQVIQKLEPWVAQLRDSLFST